MAHARKDTRARPRTWNKHFRPFMKRVHNQRERRVGKAEAKPDTDK